MDETWLYHYDPAQINNQWSGGLAAHPAPNNSERKNPLEMFSPRFFWDQDGIIPSKGPNYQRGILVISAGEMEEYFEGKRRENVSKGVLFLHDNALSHQALETQKKLAYLGFQCLDHPPYSPDLAPSDYHLFPGLKKQLKGRHFSSDAKVIAAAETWLDGQTSEFFFSGLQKLKKQVKKCIELREECVE